MCIPENRDADFGGKPRPFSEKNRFCEAGKNLINKQRELITTNYAPNYGTVIFLVEIFAVKNSVNRQKQINLLLIQCSILISTKNHSVIQLNRTTMSYLKFETATDLKAAYRCIKCELSDCRAKPSALPYAYTEMTDRQEHCTKVASIGEVQT